MKTKYVVLLCFGVGAMVSLMLRDLDSFMWTAGIFDLVGIAIGIDHNTIRLKK